MRTAISWSRGRALEQDGYDEGVYAQRYNAAGFAQGSEFRVNTYTDYAQRYSSVAMDADGDFVVAWSSLFQDDSGYGIYAQRYNASGVAQGAEFHVNTYSLASNLTPSVAMDADGDFVITWLSQFQVDDTYGIYAQHYDAAGVARGPSSHVNTYTTDAQLQPSVAMDADGDFVVAWSSRNQDGSNYGVYAQRFDVHATTEVSIVAGQLVITDIYGADTNDTLAITADHTNSVFVITDPNQLLSTTIVGATISNDWHTVTVPYALVTGGQVLVNTLGGNDSVTVTATGGDGVFHKGLDIDGGAGTDVIAINNDVNSGNTAGIALTAETINLAAKLNTDGGDIDLDGGVVLTKTTTTIDTESGNDGNAGNVTFAGTVATNSLNSRQLVVDATSTGGVSGGDVTIGSTFINNSSTRVSGATISAFDTVTVTGAVATQGHLTVIASDVDVVGTIHSGAIATVRPHAGRAIDLGTNTPGRLGLTNAELSKITGSTVVTIGHHTAGAIIQTATLTQTGKYLDLVTGQYMTRTVGEIQASKLKLRAAGRIGDAAVRMRTNVAYLEGVAGDGGMFITNAGELIIGQTVPNQDAGPLSVNGLTATGSNGQINLITGSALFVNAPVVAAGSNGAVFLQTYSEYSYGVWISANISGPDVMLLSGSWITYFFGTVTADNLTLNAQFGVGQSNDPVKIAASRLEAIGGVWIEEADDIELGGTGAALTGVSSRGGNSPVNIVAGGNITVSEAVRTFENGKLNLEAGGDLIVNAGVVSVTGDLSLSAARDISLFEGVSSSSGPIDITAGRHLTLQANLMTPDAVTLTAGGDIRRFAGTIQAFSAALDAGGDIGASGNRIFTQVANLEARGGGSIFITEADGVKIGGASGIGAVPNSLTTSFPGSNNDVVFTDARATAFAGTDASLGGSVSVAFVHPPTINAPFSIVTTIDGSGNVQITVNLATDGAGAIATPTNQLVTAISQDAIARKYVTVDNAPGNNGSQRVMAMAMTPLTGGIDGTGGLVGVQTSDADGSVQLISGGAMTVNETIATLGTGPIALQSYSGNIALGANVITVGSANIVSGGSITHTAGTVSAEKLTLIAETAIGAAAEPGRIYTSVTQLEAHAKNGGIFITESNGLEVGGITNNLTQGLQTAGSNGDIEVRVLDGALTITDGIKTHMNGVTRLRAAADITQTSGIVSAMLGAVSDAGTINLSSAANDVNYLAAQAGAAGQSVYFRDLDELYVQQVEAGGVFAGALAGVTAGHDLELKSNGYLGINRALQAGGTIRLQSNTKSVGQSSQWTISAANLSVQAGMVINLPAANNDVDVFAAAAGVGPVVFNDVDGKTIGTVAGGVLITNAVSGVTP